MLNKLIETIKNHWILVLIILSALLYSFNSVAFYPGYMSADSLTHLSEAKRIIPLTDLQPPIEPLLWRALIAITGKISAMLMFQLAMLWGGLLVLSIYVYKYFESRKLSLLPLLLGLLPWVINISGVIWSDNQMAFSLLLAIAIILITPLLSGVKMRYFAFVFSIALIVYACLSRYNAFFAVIPLIILAVEHSKLFFGHKQKIIAIAFCGLALIASIFIVKALANAEHRSSTSGFMLDDIVHSASYESIESSNIHPELKKTIHEIKYCADIKDVVIDSFWNCTNAKDRENLLILHVGDLRSFWSQTILHFPVHYAVYKLEAFTLVLFPTPGKQYVWQWGIDSHVLNLEPKYEQLGNMVRMYTLNFGYKHFPYLYEPWLWVLVHVLLLVWSRKLIVHKLFIRALSVSALLYILGFFPTGVAVDYRYIYWPVLAGLVAILLLGLEKKVYPSRVGVGGKIAKPKTLNSRKTIRK